MMSVRLAVFLGVLLIVSFPLVGVFGEFLRSFSTITRLIGVSGLARPSRCSSGSSGGTPNRTIYLRTEAAALTVDDRRARVFDGVTLAECANRCTSGFQVLFVSIFCLFLINDKGIFGIPVVFRRMLLFEIFNLNSLIKVFIQ